MKSFASKLLISPAIVAWLALGCGWASAAEVLVAVAANFMQPMQQIAQAFAKSSGHQIQVSIGASGQLSAQIQNGAPFHVLLSADAAIPAQLVQAGLGVAGTNFTYATGQLVLWSPKPELIDPQGEVLRQGRFQRIARANPKLAPYGAAAMQVVERMGLTSDLQHKWVQGENVNQAHQFVASGNADLGFLALSQVASATGKATGSIWLVPSSWHSPILQNAVLLHKGKDNAAALALMAFLKSPAARDIIRNAGYGLEPLP
ncbi:MAG: molybdate ABC transporter substrate-binding protein [Betaproteobacteria bacterium]|nr:molybdate ABC transporter substrate-binding protein [Betaproteobacteria bacterium]NBY04041.1 molybdate ABC transporter substrate-binding protein [Betaproteobacteria bacterium]